RRTEKRRRPFSSWRNAFVRRAIPKKWTSSATSWGASCSVNNAREQKRLTIVLQGRHSHPFVKSRRKDAVLGQTTAKEKLMSWWKKLWPASQASGPPEVVQRVRFSISGWEEREPSGRMRVWSGSHGSVLSLSALG